MTPPLRPVLVATSVLVLGLAPACADDDADPVSTGSPSTDGVPNATDLTATDAVSSSSSAPATSQVSATVAADPSTVAADPSTSAAPATEPAPPPTVAAEVIGPSAIGWRTAVVVDSGRPTDEVTRDGAVVLEASDVRTIPVELVYPAAGEAGPDTPPATGARRPLVVWINGLGGRAAAGDPLLLALFEAGFIVAAPNSPEVSAPAGQDADVPELPADVSAVIDALLDPGDGVADDLAPAIDPTRVGVAGHSVGGNASLALAFHDCCRDERVGAVAAYGPARLEAHGFSDLTAAGAPVLLVTGSADTIAPTAASRAVFDQAEARAYLLEIDGADHFQPIYDGPSTPIGTTSSEALVTFFGVHLSGDLDPSDIERFGAGLGNGTWQST